MNQKTVIYIKQQNIMHASPRKQIMSFDITLMELENIMLSEVRW